MRERETIYYRSEHPQALAFFSECQQAREAYHAAVKALLDEHPGFQAAESVGAGGRWRQVLGLIGEQPPGNCWGKKGTDRYWSPVRRSNAGKALASRLWGIKFIQRPIPGMPSDVFDPQRSVMHSPGFELIGGTLWVCWGAPAEQVEGSGELDPALWTRAKTSEYWLAREAQE